MTDLKIGDARVPVDPEPKLCELPKYLDDLIFEYGLAMDSRGEARALGDAGRASRFASSGERYRLRLRREIRAEIDAAAKEVGS